MKRHLPIIVLCLAFCTVFVARNWITPLLADGFTAFALPFGMLVGSVLLLVGLVILALFPVSQRRSERLKTTLILTSLATMTIAFDVAYARGLPTGSFAITFNSEQWKREGAAHYGKGDITDRQKMVGNLVYSILPGADRESLELRLGPSESGYFKALRPDLLYCLGTERAFMGIDSEWLAIWFDSHSRAARWQILND